MHSIYKRLGPEIKKRRERLGMTQAELGVIVGMTRSSIANIEAGRQRILLHDVYGFCAAFNVTPQTLMKEIW